MSIELDSRVCRCGHTGHWHGALADGQVVPMGQGGCDYCDCAWMDEVRTDTLSSLRHDLKDALDLLARAMARMPDAHDDCDDEIDCAQCALWRGLAALLATYGPGGRAMNPVVRGAGTTREGS